MEIEMTWTALYIDDDKKLLYKTVNAPHGEGDAWDYIKQNLNLDIIAIMPGSHSVFFKENQQEVSKLSYDL